MTAQLEASSAERRQVETDAANQGAALKQMEAEVQRVERRLQEWMAAGGAQQGCARGQACVH
jgi:chromosome segregation protein